MTDRLTIYTLDWVPEGPRGKVRDVRLRWACEEAGLDYEIGTVAFDDRETNHLDRQPFGQVPFIEEGGVRMFESGACLLHIAEKSEALMPRDAVGRAETQEWIVAALNSIEMATVPWWFLGLSNPATNPLDDWVQKRLDAMEVVLAERDWLATGRFTAADILMADVLRLPWVRKFGNYPATDAYVARLTGRPAFIKAEAGQIAQFEAADRLRAGGEKS